MNRGGNTKMNAQSPHQDVHRIESSDNDALDPDELVVGHGIVVTEIQKFFEKHAHKVSHVVILSDRTVRKLHKRLLENEIPGAIEKATQEEQTKVHQYSIFSGEANKTRNVKADIEDFMLQARCSRNTVVIGIGGGVVGDLSGFVAATYMRGVTFVLVPTTVMAMADASIGGKTGVNTPQGKNLVGAFHQPSKVIADIQFLGTLPLRHICNGFAEIIKIAVLRNVSMVEALETTGLDILSHPKQIMNIIAHSIREKHKVVVEDATEKGIRQILNFGHTIGHGIEAAFSHELLHGECVSIGMLVESEMAVFHGITPSQLPFRIQNLLQKFNLPTQCPQHLSKETLLNYISVDKKCSGFTRKKSQAETIPIVCMANIGEVSIPKSRTGKCVYELDRRFAEIALDSTMYLCGREPKQTLCMNSLPSSKSLCNRALLLGALHGTKITLYRFLICEDTMVMIECLRKLGCCIHVGYSANGEANVTVLGTDRKRFIEAEEIHVNVRNSGTTARFMTAAAVLLLPEGKTLVLDGNKHMHKRPIKPLVDSMNSIFYTENGHVVIKYVDDMGTLPLRIRKGKPSTLHWEVDGSLSSQYVTALAIICPFVGRDVEINITGETLTSLSFVRMTVGLMKHLGYSGISFDGRTLQWYGGHRRPQVSSYTLEPDLTAATYPLCWALISGQTFVSNIVGLPSLQEDSNFLCLVDQLGFKRTHEGDSVVIEPEKLIDATLDMGNEQRTITLPYIRALEVNMNDMTDCFMSLFAVSIFAHGTTRIRGIANQRVKECNRIKRVIEEATKLGIRAWELPDGIAVNGIIHFSEDCWLIEKLAPKSAFIDPEDDHRIAMSFSLLAASAAFSTQHSIKILQRHCVNKTFPGFWAYAHHTFGALLGSSVSPTEDEDETKTSTEVTDIILIGMRGAGKTEMAKTISEWLRIQLIDLDDTICREYGFVKCEDIINEYGWEQFRAWETSCFDSILQSRNGLREMRVISCGGGMIESEKCRSKLRYSTNSVVMWVRRPLEECIDSVLSRPCKASKNELEKLYFGREKWYKECSRFVFYTENTPVESARWLFVQFTSRILARMNGRKWFQEPCFGSLAVPSHPSDGTKFLCVNLADVRERADSSHWKILCQGTDTVELRVDCLRSLDHQFILSQVAHLRMLLPAHMNLLYTVRTSTEGGNANLSEDQYFNLVTFGITLGCDLVDIESWISENKLKHLMSHAKQAKCVSILSKHTLEPIVVEHDTVKNFVLPLCKLKPDFVKFVPTIDSDQQALKLVACSRDIRTELLSYHKVDLICFGMGARGKVSRVYNECMTPVTHRLLEDAAAPGQLTASEICQLQRHLNIRIPRDYLLYGRNIMHSFSPVLQNSGLNYLFEPPTYRTKDCQSLQDFIETAKELDRLGGANVTAPFKADALIVVDGMSKSAASIQAINTICVRETVNDVTVFGDNTDWLGVLGPVYQRLATIGVPSNYRIRAIILGAGGTSRAAIVALLKLDCDVIIVNRTASKAESLAQEFKVNWVATTDEIKRPTASQVQIIVNTTPVSSDITLPRTLYTAAITIVVETSYRPCLTPFLQQALEHNASVITGIEMLFSQGVCSFERWTQRTPPWEIMLESLYEEYSRQEPSILRIWDPFDSVLQKKINS